MSAVQSHFSAATASCPVRQRLETWLVVRREADPYGLPIATHVESELRAYLVKHLFPQVPVRRWVVTFPRRLRYFLHREMT